MGHTITVRLAKDLAVWLEERAAQTGISQGRIIREQLERAKAGDRTRRFMRLAGAIRGGPRDVSTRRGFSRS